tara:strand:- start:7211 stop:7414 length:204 start_codon:yes stop_codon:yes gene_type:complete
MRIDELIKRLKKERPNEEVVVSIGDHTSDYYLIDERPFLHAGPKRFVDSEGKPFTASIVYLRLVEKE